MTVGQDLTYTLTVRNNDPSPADFVGVSNPIPAGATPVSFTPALGDGCYEAGGVVNCEVGPLDSGATVTVTIVVRPTAAGSLTNTATVNGSTPDPDPNLANNTAATTTTVNAVSPPKTVTFDDRAGQNQALNGQYPTGVIDWGTGKWYRSAPYGQLTSKSISFNSSGVTSQTFTFVSPRKLVSLKAYNGGASTTVTLRCAGQPDKSATVAAGQLATIETNWTGICTTVTVVSTNGWDTNFDDVVHDAG